MKNFAAAIWFFVLLSLATGWANCPIVPGPGMWVFIYFPGYVEETVNCGNGSYALFCFFEPCADPVCHESDCF